MIQVRKGDVLAVSTGLIVHGCNCQGVMGGGIALAIKNKYPNVYKAYRKTFETTGLKLGNIEVVSVTDPGAVVADCKYIVNANTQDFFGTSKRQVSYDAVADCFEKVQLLAVRAEETLGYKLPVVFPAIGAGLGGGNWEIIERIIDQSVSNHFEKILYVLQ